MRTEEEPSQQRFNIGARARPARSPGRAPGMGCDRRKPDSGGWQGKFRARRRASFSHTTLTIQSCGCQILGWSDHCWTGQA
jgi:hypothetical protein